MKLKKKWTIGKRIGFGFGLILVMLIGVVYLSFSGVGQIVRNAGEVIDGNRLDGLLAQREVDHLNWAGQVNALLTDDKITTLTVQTDPTQCAFGRWLHGEGRQAAEKLVPSLAPLLKAIEEPHARLHASAIEIDNAFHQADSELGNFLRNKKVDHLNWMHTVKDAFLDPKVAALKVEKDPRQCSLGRWIYGEQAADLKSGDQTFNSHWTLLEQHHDQLHRSAVAVDDMLKRGARGEAILYYREHTQPAAEKTLAAIDRILEWHDGQIEGMETAKAIYATQTVPVLRNIQDRLKTIRETARRHIMTDQIMLEAARMTRRNVNLVGLTALIIGLILAVFIARGIVRVMRRISDHMAEGAEQVASAAGQVSSASQSLAEGSSEQAASLEETASSLEEMAAMTRQNAGHADQANHLMTSTNTVVHKASGEMEELRSSMDAIAKASDETQKIVKTIDEIAFQTNLLALNAAVEAARAGEAGAGFAVVADEVRNLAIRAADAAHDTTALIEDTANRIHEGVDLVSRSDQAFVDIAQSATKMGDLVAEIAAASNDQAQGVEQINRAVNEMDKVVQQNAANAEESASASEELSAQAEQMKGVVNDLLNLVGGSRQNIGHKEPMGIRPSDHGLATVTETGVVSPSLSGN